MTAAEIKAKITTEIGDRWAFKNAHGVDLRTCLVEPELRDYFDGQRTNPDKLWLVLEEHPKEKNGYTIVYNEEIDTFGLGVHSKQGRDICIGYYGSFMQALEGM